MKLNATMNVYVTVNIEDRVEYADSRIEMTTKLAERDEFIGKTVDVLDVVKEELRIAMNALTAVCPFTVLFEFDEIEEDEDN